MVTEVTLTVVAAGDFTNCRSTGIFTVTKAPLRFTENGPKKGKHPLRCRCVEENALLMSKVGG